MKFKTNLEKKLWEMLYRSQTALAIMCLDESNRERISKRDWPAGQQWTDLVGSSHAIFARRARIKAGINHKEYLAILRENEDALQISEDIYEKVSQITNRST